MSFQPKNYYTDVIPKSYLDTPKHYETEEWSTSPPMDAC